VFRISTPSVLLRQKLVMTALWSIALIACAMAIDYMVSILVMHNPEGYTPLITLMISAILTIPSVYVFVNGHYNLKAVSIELIAARDAAETAREGTLAAFALADAARNAAERDREVALEASAAKSQFLANMSHELRTPLNAILGYSELLALDRFADKRTEYAGLIHKSGAHLLGLINDLLDLARIEAGQMEVDGESVNLAEIIEDCVSLLQPRADSGRVILGTTLAARLPRVQANARPLKQIVLNLLSNAVKFTPPQGQAVVFAHIDPDRALLFGVRDSGIGIAAEDQQRVFERFGQARHDATVADRGTGLGLPIVKGLVEALKGRIVLKSELGQGTCVTVSIPRERLEYSTEPRTRLDGLLHNA
jgi:signal transduction histidine kinase